MTGITRSTARKEIPLKLASLVLAGLRLKLHLPTPQIPLEVKRGK